MRRVLIDMVAHNFSVAAVLLQSNNERSVFICDSLSDSTIKSGDAYFCDMRMQLILGYLNSILGQFPSYSEHAERAIIFFSPLFDIVLTIGFFQVLFLRIVSFFILSSICK